MLSPRITPLCALCFSALGQLLYLPSLGACVLAGSMLRRPGSNHSRGLATSPAYGGESGGGRSNTTPFNLNRATKDDDDDMVGNCDDDCAEQKDTAKERTAKAASPGETKEMTPVAFGSSPAGERQQGSQKLLRRPRTPPSPFSRSSSATARAPACSCSSAFFLRAGKQGAEKVKAPPRMLGRRSQLLPARHTVVLAVLLSWAAFFGVGTLRRCKDWNSERALFESAIKVCPDGIKTLNNMAASMLNTEEAARAEVLLLRAVEVHIVHTSRRQPGRGSAGLGCCKKSRSPSLRL